MTTDHHVLLLGATGRTGGRALGQLLDRGVPVRVIVRSAQRLPTGTAGHPLVEVVETELLALGPDRLAGHLAGCDTVVSCLGHPISMRGVLGPPRHLVEQALRDVRAATLAAPDPGPASRRVILMSSVSVNQPEHADRRRGRAERTALWAIRGVVPPARDNQRAADFLVREVGTDDPRLAWVIVRPDSLLDGEVAQYRVHSQLVDSLFHPGHTRMANVAHFIAELVTSQATWEQWQGRLPVIVDDPG